MNLLHPRLLLRALLPFVATLCLHAQSPAAPRPKPRTPAAKAAPVPPTPEQVAAIRTAAAQVRLAPPGHLVFVGDSLTAGLPAVNYVALIREALQSRLGTEIRVTNAGVNGDSITRVQARLARDVLNLSPKPTHVFIFLGHNDSKLSWDSGYQASFVSPEDYETQYREVITMIQNSLGAKVTVISATSSVYELTKAIADAKAKTNTTHNLFGQPASLERFNAIARRVAAERKADYLDVYEPTRRHPNKSELYLKDGVHVNERGNAVLAIEILKYLGKAQTPTGAGASVPGASAPQSLKDFVRVVIADDAGPVQKAAAEELAHYASRIAGTNLAIVPWSDFAKTRPGGLSFFVGDGASSNALGERLAPWRTEEWLIRSLPNGLALAGHDGAGDPWSASTAAGSMLAVYTLLDEHLGVHWFWPGAFGEHVPQNPAAAIPHLNLRRTPAFSIRDIKLGYATYHNAAFKEAERKWARRSRLAWVKSAIFGHSWEVAFELRKGETFKAHPEWFALVDGQRRPPQMCTTHPDVIARMVEYVLNGKQDIMNISPSDGGGFCECDRCRALDVPGVLAYDGKHVQLSDRIFTYANEVARRVREKNPEKGCGMFAYTFYNRPPVKIAKLEPNLWLSFVFQSAAHRNPDNLREWRDNIAGWKHLGARMVVREGWGNHYYHDLPFLHYHQIANSLAAAHELGFTAAYGEGSKNFATMAPNFWAITRMMWDATRDRTQLMPEFYRSAYGPAAAEMEAYFETYNRALDANWSKMARNVDTTQIAYANITATWHELLPASVVDAAEGHLRAAERAATTGEYADRVRFHRLGQDYARLMLELLDSYRRLAVLGLKLDTFSAIFKERREDPAARAALLRRTFDLGEQREKMLLAHRDQAGPDEGLYGYTNEARIRQWHAAVKQELGIATPSAVTKAALMGR